MSKDQKSMGRRNVILAVLCSTVPPHLPLSPLAPSCITSVFPPAAKVSFCSPPFGAVTQARGSRLTMFGYRQKIALLLKGYRSRFIELHVHQKEVNHERASLMRRFVFHVLIQQWWRAAGNDQWHCGYRYIFFNRKVNSHMWLKYTYITESKNIYNLFKLFYFILN